MATIDATGPAALTVVLTGAECSGKTTLARRLAERLGAPTPDASTGLRFAAWWIRR